MNTRTVSLAALLAACPLALPAAADDNEYSRMAVLETLALAPGGNTTLQVRSPHVGGMVTIFTDPFLGTFDLGLPRPLLCLPPTLMVVSTGAIGADGTYSVTVPTPAAGTTFSVQAVVVDANMTWFASQCRTVTVPPSTPPTFVNDSASLDPATALFSASDVDFADLNRDGCPDAIISNDGTGSELLMLISDCTGTFSSEAMFRLPAAAVRPTSTVEMADVDNDGHVDLFLGGGSDLIQPGQNLLLINDGNGFFDIADGPAVAPIPGKFVDIDPCAFGTDCFGLPGGRGYANDAAFGDIDADGDPDLFVANTDDFDWPLEIPERVQLYRNQGGSFVPDKTFAQLPGNQSYTSSVDISIGDLDRDGDLDVFISAVNSQNQLYANDGTGTFTNVTASALPPEVDDSFESELGDFDGDGDVDIFVANNITTDVTAIPLLRERDGHAGHPALHRQLEPCARVLRSLHGHPPRNGRRRHRRRRGPGRRRGDPRATGHGRVTGRRDVDPDQPGRCPGRDDGRLHRGADLRGRPLHRCGPGPRGHRHGR